MAAKKVFTLVCDMCGKEEIEVESARPKMPENWARLQVRPPASGEKRYVRERTLDLGPNCWAQFALLVDREPAG